MEMTNVLKLKALECAIKNNADTLVASWEYSKETARKKSELKGEPKTELELALDAYAAYSYACGMTALELLEREKLVVVSPSRKFEAACRLATTPFAFMGTKTAIDEILSIAKNNVEARV